MSYRLRAFALHLSVCMVVALICLIVVFKFWYPSPLDKATGVASIFLMLLACDVVLGPVLTSIVANPKKRYLKMDFAIIGVIQVAALSYGLWAVEAGRPVWLVFSVDRFDLVQAYELDNPYREKAEVRFSEKNWFGPKWVAARLPKDVDQLNTLTFEALMAGIDVPQRPDLYVDLADEFDTVVDKARPVADLLAYNDSQHVEQYMERYPQADVFLPLMARAKQMSVLIDTVNREIVAVVDLMPWE